MIYSGSFLINGPRRRARQDSGLFFSGRLVHFLRQPGESYRLGGREEQPGLFDPPLEKEVAEVRLNGVKLERMRRFGDVCLGCKLRRMARLELFSKRIEEAPAKLQRRRREASRSVSLEKIQRQVGRLCFTGTFL